MPFTISKNASWISFVIFPLLTIQLLLEGLFFVFIGKPSLTVMVMKALMWNFTDFRESWTLHLKTHRIRRKSDREIMSKMTKKNLKALKMLRSLRRSRITPI